MAKVIKLGDGDRFQYAFQCPGCEQMHGIGSGWSWNGDYDKPTITPSILVRGTKMTDKGWADYTLWCDAGYPKQTEGFDSVPTVCHSFVTDGKIEFLNDCTHSLAGQTIELSDEEEW